MCTDLMNIFPPFSVFPQIKRVILFGSRAREDHEGRSDIDLAIDAPAMDISSWSDFCTYMEEKSNTLLKLDLIRYQEAGKRLKENIEKDGVVLYMREQTKGTLDNLKRALSRLNEALEQSDNMDDTVYIDGTIHRFEFCFELFSKTLRRALLELGLDTKTPRDAIKMAYQARFIDNEKLWLQMLRDRNETSHIYDKDTAREMFKRISSYYDEMIRVSGVINHELQD